MEGFKDEPPSLRGGAGLTGEVCLVSAGAPCFPGAPGVGGGVGCPVVVRTKAQSLTAKRACVGAQDSSHPRAYE